MVENSLNEQIKFIAEKFSKESADKEIQVISHFDTDGITSATIMIQTLKKIRQKIFCKNYKKFRRTIYL